MKILTIGQPDSPHSVSFARRLRINFPKVKSFFFASSPFEFAAELASYCDRLIRSPGPPVYYQAYWQDLQNRALSKFSGNPTDLVTALNELKPSHVNINAIQDAGYLLLEAMKDGNLYHKDFKVNLFVWGNDLFYFQHHPLHKNKISEVLAMVDTLVPESSREGQLAWRMGYRGKISPPIEATLITFEELTGKFSGLSRRKSNQIIIKSAFQSGRTLNGVALKALGACADLLYDWDVVLIAPGLEDWRSLQTLTDLGSVKISVSAGHLPKERFYSLLAESRLMISLNLSDGVSNTFLECCASGTYPILSTSACIADWGKDAALLLDPYDSEAAKVALRSLFLDINKVDLLTDKNFERLKRYQSSYVNALLQSVFSDLD